MYNMQQKVTFDIMTATLMAHCSIHMKTVTLSFSTVIWALETSTLQSQNQYKFIMNMIQFDGQSHNDAYFSI